MRSLFTTRRAVRLAGVYAGTGGLLSLAGWVFDLPRLTDWDADDISIQPNATLCVIFSAMTLLALAAGRSRLTMLCGSIVLLIGGATLLQWLSGLSFGIDSLLLFDRPWGRVGVVFPGRMGPPGSLCWTVIGVALVLGTTTSRLRRCAPALALTTAAISALSIVGYLYGVETLYAAPYLTVIALQTSTFILAVSIGIIASHPDREPMSTLLETSIAGHFGRRTVPLIVLFPVISGWVWLEAHGAGLYDTRLGIALFALLLVASLAALLWWALRAIRAREQALRDSELQLRATDRRKDEFLATLAHELRNPLAPIRNAVQILRMKGPAIPELQFARDVIDRQVRQMTRLMDDLMDVSRIGHGKFQLDRRVVALSELVRVALETSRPLVDSCGHRLAVSLPEEIVFVDADLTRLAQMIANLLNNAAKFTEQGGMIRLMVERQARDVVVSVKDSGIGIPRDQLQNVFELFVQVQGALERPGGGLGIGLSLVKGIVEMHGGSIVAHSDGPGTGSEFVARLPIVVEQETQAAREDSGDWAVSTPPLRILIVDDNRDAADSFGMMLRAAGNDIRLAHDGEDAVRAAEEFRPQVVLLDIGLPKLNGYEVCRVIRQQPWGKQMLLVAVTGWGQDDDKRKADDAGFNGYMVKPVDPRSVFELLGAATTRPY